MYPVGIRRSRSPARAGLGFFVTVSERELIDELRRPDNPVPRNLQIFFSPTTKFPKRQRNPLADGPSLGCDHAGVPAPTLPSAGSVGRPASPTPTCPDPPDLQRFPFSTPTTGSQIRPREISFMATNDPRQSLQEFAPAHEFFVGIDSDGCVFDSMEIKHKECFTPMFIKHFGLQAISKYAREVWEFVNLYSKSRGINRYPALSNALNLLAERPEVHARGIAVPTSDELDAWMAREPRHTLATLRQEVEERGNTALQPILEWSRAVDAQIKDIVHGVPPFPGVREVLTRLRAQADAMVISQTPTSALEREWAAHDLTQFVALIAGQELGTKKDHLRLAAAPRYPGAKILMIGDAPGDFNAAKFNGALFFPIIPGREEASWQRLLDEGLDVFFGRQYAGDYEAGLVREFQACLPDRPSW